MPKSGASKTHPTKFVDLLAERSRYNAHKHYRHPIKDCDATPACPRERFDRG